MTTRYDYRTEYAKMSIIELRDALSKLIDRLLSSIGVDGKTADDYTKRISYVEARIKKHDKKQEEILKKNLAEYA